MKKIDTCITESVCCTAEIKHNIVSQLHVNKTKKRTNSRSPENWCSHELRTEIWQDMGGEGLFPQS